MGSLVDGWATVTAPQATIISGSLALLAAIMGVLLGWWLFSGRVKDLKSAIDQTEKFLESHRSATEETLSRIVKTVDACETKIESLNTKIEALNTNTSTLTEKLGTVGANVTDLQSSTSLIDERISLPQIPTIESLREDWSAIRDRLEQLAAAPEVDGRTRAKYARIDRRVYPNLIEALNDDKQLGKDGPRYLEAATIWQRNKSGRRPPSAEDINRLSALRKELAGGDAAVRGL